MKKLRLFHITDDQVERLPASLFSYEDELQDLLEQHLHDFLDVHFLKRKHRTDSGEIDTLGIDDAGRPVIIEYKRDTDKNVIGQGLGYLGWLSRNRAEFKLLVIDKLDNERARHIVWSPRLLIIASDFRDMQVDAAQTVQNIELLCYRRFGEQDFALEWVHGGAAESTPLTAESLSATAPKPAPAPSLALPDIGEFRYRGRMSDKAWALFRELLAVAQTLGHFRLDGFETYLAFRRKTEADGIIRWPLFASVRPNITPGIRVDVLERTQSAPLETGFTSLTTGHRTMQIRNRADLEKARPLLRDSYNRY